jgi:hypothetical protein
MTKHVSGCATNRPNRPATLAFVRSKASNESRVKHLTPISNRLKKDRQMQTYYLERQTEAILKEISKYSRSIHEVLAVGFAWRFSRVSI